MGTLPFALSIHHFINSVGADAGFAAIIGLALLILLYFAQARETNALRNHADEAGLRIQQLEARLAQLSRAQPAMQAPPPVNLGAVAPGPIAARAMVPAAPAGVAAPALAAATRLIPTATPAAIPAPAAVPAASQQAAAAVAVAAPVAAVAGAGAPPPATVAGGANGSGTTVPPRTAPGNAGVDGQPGIQRRGAPPGSPPGRRSAGGPPGRVPPPRSGSRMPRGLGIALAALGVIGIVVVLLIVTGSLGSSSSSSSSSSSRASNAPRDHRVRAATINPATVTVSVLNGTATNGLAHRLLQRLAGVGYKQGTQGNAPLQTHTTTTVAYLPGFKREAEAVATSLKLGPSVVQPVDQNTQSVACSGQNPCTTNVVVTVGANLANTT